MDGNDYFKAKNYVKAIECYNASLQIQPTKELYSNRAQALILFSLTCNPDQQSELLALALEDAKHCI